MPLKTAAFWFRAASVIALFMAPLSQSLAQNPVEPEILRVLSSCPPNLKTCIVAQASFMWGPNQRSRDHPAYRGSFQGDTSYYWEAYRVTGRLDGGPLRGYILLIELNDGLECEDFTVPVVGVTPSSGFLVTDRGVLELEEPNIEIGWRDSLAIFDEKTLQPRNHLTPHWEGASWRNRVIVTPEGHVLWRYRGICLDIETDGMFREVSGDGCNTDHLVKADSRDLGAVAATGRFTGYELERLKYDLWRFGELPYIVYVYGVACT